MKAVIVHNPTHSTLSGDSTYPNKQSKFTWSELKRKEIEGEVDDIAVRGKNTQWTN